MAFGLFALAVILTVLSGIVLLIVGASVEWEDPGIRFPPLDNILAALALLIAQAICWGIWGGFFGGTA